MKLLIAIEGEELSRFFKAVEVAPDNLISSYAKDLCLVFFVVRPENSLDHGALYLTGDETPVSAHP